MGKQYTVVILNNSISSQKFKIYTYIYIYLCNVLKMTIKKFGKRDFKICIN